MKNQLLQGQKTLVTGANSGIGEAIAKALAGEGAAVVINYISNADEAERELCRLIPYGRIGEPADIGKAAVWLASDESDYLTGASIFVDGGMTLYPGFRTGG